MHPRQDAPPLRRFSPGDVAALLDMGVIGDVCVGVTLVGWQQVTIGLLQAPQGNLALLLRALDGADVPALSPLAHALRGGAASVGLRGLAHAAQRIESEGPHFAPPDCTHAAELLRHSLHDTTALLQRMGLLQAR